MRTWRNHLPESFPGLKPRAVRIVCLIKLKVSAEQLLISWEDKQLQDSPAYYELYHTT